MTITTNGSECQETCPDRVHEHRLRLSEEGVEIAILDEPAKMPDAAGDGDRQPEGGGHQAEQHLDIAQPPAPERRHVSHERPPEHEKREVVERHEHDLDGEGASQGERGLEVGRDQRSRERQAVNHH
jgi:hypothetical protein